MSHSDINFTLRKFNNILGRVKLIYLRSEKYAVYINLIIEDLSQPHCCNCNTIEINMRDTHSNNKGQIN